MIIYFLDTLNFVFLENYETLSWTQANRPVLFLHYSWRWKLYNSRLAVESNGGLEHRFSLSPAREDMYAQDSIELLTTSGIQFKKHEEEGIETQYFAELLMTSGVVLCEGVKWLSFHR